MTIRPTIRPPGPRIVGPDLQVLLGFRARVNNRSLTPEQLEAVLEMGWRNGVRDARAGISTSLRDMAEDNREDAGSAWLEDAADLVAKYWPQATREEPSDDKPDT